MSDVDVMLRKKLQSLAVAITETQQRLNDQLLALLEPERLVTLWKLKGVLAKIEALLGSTLDQPDLRVSESMLELVQATESILEDIEARLAIFDAKDV